LNLLSAICGLVLNVIEAGTCAFLRRAASIVAIIAIAGVSFYIGIHRATMCVGFQGAVTPIAPHI
jgi:hypothetical protein